jgi:single-stranded-DNA-specific exonuclease
LAQRLDARNRERQTVERGIAKDVLESVRARFDPARDFAVVEGHADWHLGVVGIVASRVLQEFYRPTIILGGDNGQWRGSGRSIEGFDLAAALRECNDLLLRHGGHAMACGVGLAPENLDAFRTRLNQIARRTLQPEQFSPPLRIDGIVTLGQITFEQLRDLQKLEQCGNGNPPVQLVARNLHQPRPLQRFGPEKRHVRFWVTDGQTTREAVWWNGGELSLPVGEFDLAFAPSLSEYNGLYSIQLKVLDWRAS